MKSGLDVSVLKNFRPVSNLSFLLKLLERITQSRLQLFLDSNDLMPETQSAYTGCCCWMYDNVYLLISWRLIVEKKM